MEEHEIELLAALHDRIIDRLSPNASDEKQRAAAVAILKEDSEARDLYMRLKLIEHFGGGHFVRSVVELRDS
jgi:hypothetical protein